MNNCCATCINNQDIVTRNNTRVPYCCEHSFLIPKVDSICCREYSENRSINKAITYYYDPYNDKIIFNKKRDSLYNNWLGEK